MFLAILGIFVAIFAGTISKANPNLANFGKVGRYIGIALVVLGIASSCFVQVSPGVAGVQTLFG